MKSIIFTRRKGWRECRSKVWARNTTLDDVVSAQPLYRHSCHPFRLVNMMDFMQAHHRLCIPSFDIAQKKMRTPHIAAEGRMSHAARLLCNFQGDDAQTMMDP